MVRAAAVVAPNRIESVDLPLPDVPVGAVLRVEVCGLCGTDVEQYRGHFRTDWGPGALIPGHEVVGVIDSIDDDTACRWGVTSGDRVAVEPNLPCGTCARCLEGSYVSCRGWPRFPMAYGFIPMSHTHGLWGGWSEALVLHPSSVVHRVPDGLDAGVAGLFNALGAGFRWAVALPRLRIGQTVVVFGAGQRGLACVAAAKAAGAGLVIATGLSKDRHKLDAALALGADLVVDVEARDAVDAVRDATGSAMADVAIDASAGATQPVRDAIACVRDEGTVVLAGLKGGRTADGIPVDDIVLRGVSILGARSAEWTAYEQALAHLARVPDDFRALRTHEYALDDADTAVRMLGGDIEGADPIYVSIRVSG